MHNHNHCQHELKHCQQCDVAYCSKCGQEWGQHAHTTLPLPPRFVRAYPWWEWKPEWYVRPDTTGTWTTNGSSTTTTALLQ